jgi:hypothetical protein
LFGIVIVGVLYIIFSNILYGQITPLIYPSIAAINSTTSGVNTTQLATTLNLINTVWMAFPLVFILGLILWAFMASQRPQPVVYQ